MLLFLSFHVWICCMAFDHLLSWICKLVCRLLKRRAWGIANGDTLQFIMHACEFNIGSTEAENKGRSKAEHFESREPICLESCFLS